MAATIKSLQNMTKPQLRSLLLKHGTLPTHAASKDGLVSQMAGILAAAWNVA